MQTQNTRHVKYSTKNRENATQQKVSYLTILMAKLVDSGHLSRCMAVKIRLGS